MISRMVAAAARAFLLALLIATPTMLLPTTPTDTSQMVALLALLAAILVFVEYNSAYPSLVEFRDASPFNRSRFAALFLTVLVLSLITRSAEHPFTLGLWLTDFGARVGLLMDFPFSPVRLVLLQAPVAAAPDFAETLRTMAGLAYLVSLGMLASFAVLIRYFDWPIRKGPFNFWINLPLFDPTGGGDVLRRLKRDGNINVVLGFLLPFLIPAVVQAATAYGLSVDMANPQTLIWMITAWAFLPASLIMRGMALMRIADLIEEKRRRAYRQADLQTV